MCAIFFLLKDGSISNILGLNPTAGPVLVGVTSLKEFAALRPYINRQESLGKDGIVKHFSDMQIFYRDTLQPRLIAKLEEHAAAPIDKLKGHLGQSCGLLSGAGEVLGERRFHCGAE